jgi:hypothetical protein
LLFSMWEREKEVQALFGEGLFGDLTDLVLNYGRDNQTVATMWSSPIKFQDLFFYGRQNGGVC